MAATEAPSIYHPEVRSYEEVNRDAMRLLTNPGPGYILVFMLALSMVGLLGLAVLYMVAYGMGVTGLNNPNGWAVLITDFVFWVGIGHAGTLISAILFLFRAAWRQAIYRLAEAMTVFAVLTAGLFPLLHVGRPWFAYWLLPYPNQRQIWPNFRSPLEWDVFAVSTYLTVSSVFFFIGLIPDIAAARDAATVPWRKKVYSALALGWRGTNRQWLHFTRAYLFLAALATPLVLSVHSVVSWDFAVSINPGWHTTIFAPYFVAGAILSGVAMVVSIAVPVRKAFRLEKYLTDVHFDRMGKLLLLVSCIVGYAYAMEYFMAYYSGELYERDVFWDRAFGDYAYAAWTMIICNAFVPQLLWFKKIRTNLRAFFVISILVNIGMWYERFVIIVPSLSHSYYPWKFLNFRPTWVDGALTLGSFGWFFMFFLIFLRVLPSLSIAEIKEILPAPIRGITRRGAEPAATVAGAEQPERDRIAEGRTPEGEDRDAEREAATRSGD